MMKYKKQGEMSMQIVVAAVILLVVAFSVIAIFGNLFGKQAGQIGDQIDRLGDEDDDGIANMFDKCPCDPGESEYDGCLTQKDLDETKGKPKPKSCA